MDAEAVKPSVTAVNPAVHPEGLRMEKIRLALDS